MNLFPRTRNYNFLPICLRPIFRHPEFGSKIDDIKATGFFLRRGEELFIVTNRHNVDIDYYKKEKTGYLLQTLSIDYFFMEPRENNTSYISKISANVELNKDTFCYSENYIEDVAVARIHLRERMNIMAIDYYMVGNASDYEASDPGDSVVIIGQSHLENRFLEMPLVRSGTIASDPLVNYVGPGDDEARRVAVEVYSNEGMSGAPVIAIQKIAGTKGKDFLVRRPYLLGVNSGNYIDIHKKLVKIPSGISYCYKSLVVSEIIETQLTSKDQTHA